MCLGGGVLDFSQMTEELGRALIADGHFMIICDHGGGIGFPSVRGRLRCLFCLSMRSVTPRVLMRVGWGMSGRGSVPFSDLFFERGIVGG